jgi:hypothetical protein
MTGMSCGKKRLFHYVWNAMLCFGHMRLNYPKSKRLIYTGGFPPVIHWTSASGLADPQWIKLYLLRLMIVYCGISTGPPADVRADVRQCN